MDQQEKIELKEFALGTVMALEGYIEHGLSTQSIGDLIDTLNQESMQTQIQTARDALSKLGLIKLVDRFDKMKILLDQQEFIEAQKILLDFTAELL